MLRPLLVCASVLLTLHLTTFACSGPTLILPGVQATVQVTVKGLCKGCGNHVTSIQARMRYDDGDYYHMSCAPVTMNQVRTLCKIRQGASPISLGCRSLLCSPVSPVPLVTGQSTSSRAPAHVRARARTGTCLSTCCRGSRDPLLPPQVHYTNALSPALGGAACVCSLCEPLLQPTRTDA